MSNALRMYRRAMRHAIGLPRKEVRKTTAPPKRERPVHSVVPIGQAVEQVAPPKADSTPSVMRRVVARVKRMLGRKKR